MSDAQAIERRALLQAGFAAALTLAAPPLASAQSGPIRLDDATRTWLRLVGDLSGRPVVSVTEGMVWGFKPQADDLTVEDFARRLYGYRAVAIRKTARRQDGSIALTTHAWSFYTDAVSGQVVSSLNNPYTGMQVQCPPLSGPASTMVFGSGAEGAAKPVELAQRRLGDHAFFDVDRLSRFKPSDTTWFKLEADLTVYHCRSADVDSAAAGHIPSTWSHNLVAEWQTWMKMHGAPGHILFNGHGAVLSGPKALPAELYDAVARYFPDNHADLTEWSKGARS